MVRKDRFDGKAGVAILVAKGINYSELQFIDNFNEDIMVCGIALQNLNVLSVYSPPNVTASFLDWKNLFSQFLAPILIGGDFNAHNTSWGCSSNNNKGTVLLNAVDECDLVVLNTGSPTKLSNCLSNTRSAVDISLCSPAIAPHFDWEVCDDTLGSDHLVIGMKYNNWNVEKEIIYPSCKFNTKSADWEIFHRTMTNQFQNPVMGSAQNMYSFFLNTVNAAAETSMKIKTPFVPNKKPLPVWWDEECNKAVEKRKQTFWEYKHNASLDNYIRCQKVVAETKRLLKKKARDSWKSYCSGLNRSTPASEVWKQIKKMKGSPSARRQPVNTESITQMFYNLTPDYVQEYQLPASTSNRHNILLEPFNMNELNYAINMNTNTAPGHDEISYPIIAHLPYTCKEYLLAIFNKIYLDGEEIEEFKNIIVVPILKPLKPSDDVDSYRPISLLSCVRKTLERMIKLRLEWWLEHHGLYPNFQFGFRRGMGTYHAAGKLVTDIQLCFSRNNYLAAIFLDLKSAYDSVDLTILEQGLFKLGIPPKINRNIINMFRGRKLFLRKPNNTLMGPRFASQGLPQGSVLSPILFNIYTNDIYFENNVKIVQYADDFIIYTEGRKLNNVVESLDKSFHDIRQWAIEKSFLISYKKTIASIFSRHNLPERDTIVLDDCQVTYKKVVKYLGFYLDQKLTWKSHIENIISKSEKQLNIIRSCNKISWGADPEISLLMYKSLIRSVIDYGAIFYGAASNNLLYRLDILQNKTLRVCLGLMKSSPIEAMRVEAKEPPLHFRRQLLGEKFVLKLRARDNDNLLKPIYNLCLQNHTNKYWNKKKSPPLAESFSNTASYDGVILKSIIPPIFTLNHFAHICITPLVIRPPFIDNQAVNRVIYTNLMHQYSDDLQIYTDGSKNENGTGCAFYIPELETSVKYRLPNQASIFSAEALAILKALEYCYHNADRRRRKVTIISDSQSVLSGLKHFNVKSSPLLTDILKMYVRLTQRGYTITFIWIKAHCGFVNNEKVDLLAKAAITHYDDKCDLVPYSDIMVSQRKNINMEWNVYYKNTYSEHPTNYFLLNPQITTKRWYDNYEIKRNTYITITRLHFNHGRFPAHLYKIGIKENDLCECGNPGDINHIFLGCPRYKHETNTFIHKLLDKNLSMPLNMNYILNFKTKDIYYVIMDFIKKCDIQI